MSIANVAANNAGVDQPAWRDRLDAAMALRCLMKPRDGFVSLLPVFPPQYPVAMAGVTPFKNPRNMMLALI
jgi:hypothetical protein